MMATKAQIKALRYAMFRPRNNICPILGVKGAASDALVDSLLRNGWAVMDGRAPRITEAGIKIAALRSEPTPQSDDPYRTVNNDERA